MNILEKQSSGLAGLDEILFGGLIPQKAYLIQGGPGSGKSTFGLHFLCSSKGYHGKALYITLGESEGSIARSAEKMGIDHSGIHFLDLSPQEELQENSGSYSLFSPSEVEHTPIMKAIIDAVEEHKPDRVVLDSITMLRFLYQDAFQMRKMVLSFIKFITDHGATLMLISEAVESASEQDATFLVDGVIHLKEGSDWRKIQIRKYRGSEFMSGEHAFKIDKKGITVFPRMRANEYSRRFEGGVLSSGVDGIDELLHGGIEQGTVTLIVGATGVGKTNLGVQFLKEAATRNERSALYSFEESKELIINRSENLNIPVEKMMETGNLKIMPVEPLSYSPDEFSKMVRTDVEENGTRLVMIDSVGGYDLAIRDEDILERLHSLTVYLQNMGVTTLLINESPQVSGPLSATEMNASYLSDNIIYIRYVETNGEIRKFVGVLKKRLSDFEKSVREYIITSEGLQVGKPVKNMRGILGANPQLTD